MKTLLTVDWDFFVEEKIEWDMGHRESLLFLKMIWGTRGNLINQMKLTGEEKDFWKRIGLVRLPGAKPLWVSDSHSYAYVLTKGVNRVINFDAHHDCWHSDSLGVDKQEKAVYCHNWLRTWLEGSKKRKATWVRPKWLEKGVCEVPEDLADRVEVIDGLEGLKLGLQGAVDVHICRSGCWVPPWLDKAFLGFVGALEGGLEDVVDMQRGEWSALSERWTDKDFKSVLEADRKMQEAFGKFGKRSSKGYTMMEVPSGSFLKGSEEVRV